MKPVVRTRFRRTAWLIERDGSRIEVVLDEGKVASGDKEAPLYELELELLSGKPAALFALAEELGEAAALRLGVLTKAERGFALAEKKLGRAAKAEPVRLKPPLTEAGAFQAVASACLRHFRLNEIALRAGPRSRRAASGPGRASPAALGPLPLPLDPFGRGLSRDPRGAALAHRPVRRGAQPRRPPRPLCRQQGAEGRARAIL